MDAAPTAKPVSEVSAWHAITVNEVLKRLTTSTEKGLDVSEASTRLQKYGPNRLPEGKKRGPFMRFLAQLNNILVYVLLGAGFVKLMLGLWLDAGIIFGVVLLNALLGFIQEGKAEKALDSIRNMLSAEARTTRGGETRMIPADELVPGDIVLLESGDKVPADLRLADAKNLRTEEAALTGESVPAEKTTDPVAEKSTVGDRDSMAFSGTMVVSGRATGVVVATGSETELGRINQLLASVSALETPLLRQIKKLGYLITAAVGVVGVLVFAYGRWVMGMEFVELFQAIVGIAVSLIPEGLPALITITLAIGVQRMAQRNAIIRRLPAVETLGSVSRICSDKTGTLTLMEMMVVSAATAESEYQVTGNGYAPEGEVKQDGKPADKSDPVLGLLGRVSMLCNDAELFQQEGVWKVEGDPTEGALYPFATKLGMDRQAEQKAYPRIDAIPFESEHKFMATLHKSADGKEILSGQGRARGHPRELRPAADPRRQDRTARPRAFAKVSDKLAGQGERVLGLAWLENPGVKVGTLGPADLPKNLVLLGLIGLLDPPRKEAIEAVKECHGGGIRVTMITGDHKITAAAIAKMLGIGDGKTAVAGTEIEEMNEAALQETVRDVDVFARASPEHKLRLVKAIQANKQICAMTGDGVNDAPSLEESRHRRGDGDQGYRGNQGGGRDDPRRRQLRLDRRGGEGRAHGLQQHRESDPVPVSDQRRPGAGHRGGDLPRLHLADHRATGAVGQHGDLGGAWSGALLRTARARRDDPAAAGGRPADPDRVRDLARHLRRLGATGSDVVGVFLDEVAERIGPARADGRGQHDHDRPDLLPAQQPLPAGLLAVFQGASRQQVPAPRHWRGHNPAAPLHLCASATGLVRQRSDPALGLATPLPGRPDFLPRRGGGEDDYPFVGLLAECRDRGGSGGVRDCFAKLFMVREPHHERDCLIAVQVLVRSPLR